MRYQRLILFSSLIGVCMISFYLINNSIQSEEFSTILEDKDSINIQNNNNVNPIPSYTANDPIKAVGEAAFIDLKDINEWLGDGTAENPYQINGFHFNSGDELHNLIELHNIDFFIEIKNCFLEYGNIGIFLHNVSNIIIFKNIITDCHQAIFSEFFCDNIKIDNNMIYKNQDYGIILKALNNSIIENNQVFNNSNSGIFINSLGNNTILNNIIANNTNDGIYIDYSNGEYILNNTIYSNLQRGCNLNAGHNVTIDKNSIFNNTDGIFLNRVDFVYLYNNSIYQNFNDGFSSYGSELSVLMNNVFYYNHRYGLILGSGAIDIHIHMNNITYNEYEGLKIESTYNNTISSNNFIGNNASANDDAFNFFKGNYWENWTIPDENKDGIVDIPFTIPGAAKLEDPNPSVNPIYFSFSGSVSENEFSNPNENPSSLKKFSLFTPENVMIFSGCVAGFGIVSIVVNKIKTFSSLNSPKHIARQLISPNLAGFINTNNQIIGSKPNIIFYIPKSLYLLLIAPIIWILAHVAYNPNSRQLVKDEILENSIRNKIITMLEKVEFENFNAIQKKLSCGVSILRWHLQVLEDFKFIEKLTIGKYKIYFISDGRIDRRKAEIYCSLRSETALTIVCEFLKNTMINWKIADLARLSHQDYKVTQYYCKKLAKLNVVEPIPKLREYKLIEDQREYLLWLIARNQIYI